MNLREKTAEYELWEMLKINFNFSRFYLILKWFC